MKKILSLTLAAALTLGLAIPTLAASETVDAPVGGRYGATVTLDGEELDLSGIPGAPAGYVPMRAICEASYGGLAEWYPDDNQALFFLDNIRFLVDFSTLEVQVEFEPVDAQAYLDPNGYTFLPVSLLNGQGSIQAVGDSELNADRYDVKTSASDPTMQLTRAIQEACGMFNASPNSIEDMVEYYGFTRENYETLVSIIPSMNIVSNSILIAQVAEGKMDAAKEDFAAFQAQQIAAFEYYLPTPYEMAQNGQIVASPDGTHLMLIISSDNDAAIALFNAAYPAAQ